MKRYKNTVNTSTYITKTPTHTHTYTLQNPHISKPTHTHTHTLQNPPHTHTHTLQNPHIHTPTHHETSENRHSTRYAPNKMVTIQFGREIRVGMFLVLIFICLIVISFWLKTVIPEVLPFRIVLPPSLSGAFNFCIDVLYYPSLPIGLSPLDSHAPHTNVLVSNGPHIRWWSHNNIIYYYIIQGVPGGMDKTSGECSLC